MKRIFACIALSLCLVYAAGCGGGAGTAVSTATNLPTQEFPFKTPTGPLRFTVQSSSETEFRGTGMTQSLSFEWVARDWEAAGDSVIANVTFSKIKGAMRRGSSISMEPIKEVERLEGFAWDFKRDATGFEPKSEPARDREFMAVFGQLQMGTSTLGLEAPKTPIAPGGSWEMDTGTDGALGPMSDSVTSSNLVATYKGNELFSGRNCAKIEFKGKIEIDGEMGEGEERAQVSGTVKIEGSGYYDFERGFMIRSTSKVRTSMKQRPLDEKGKPAGAEQGFMQTASITVSLASE